MKNLKLGGTGFFAFFVFMVALGCTGNTGSNQANVIENETLAMAEPAAENVATEALEAKQEKKYKVTFIELGSVRCIPCQKMVPIMKSIEENYGDQVKVIFYDVWTPEGQPFGQKYGINLIPTQVFLDENGEEYFRHEGFFPEEELVKVLKMKGVI
ncbi:MAG: thioredoxin family protein [Bacteroides sp.]|jgi:thioredoxin 1|nr:thioredoxin family protein [Bacteroides sp.]